MMSRSDSAVAAEEPLLLNPLPSQLGTRQSRSEFALSSLLLVIVLAIVSTVVVLGIRRSGDFALDDEARHAMTGAYFADLLSDLPLSHPIQYTYAYYARYPTLGLIHWPPLFPFVEGLAFLALGPSIVVARLTVLVFVTWGLIFWFLLVRELLSPWAAAFATLILFFLPALFLYEQAVMLEVPSLALCLSATYFWVRFLRTGHHRALYAFAGMASLAMLTKQQCVYLLPFCLLTLLPDGEWRRLLTIRGAATLAFFGMMLAPFYILAIRTHLASIADHVVQKHAWHISSLTFYLRTMPQQMGWLVLALSLAGIALSHWWSPRRDARLMLIWILACYFTFSFLNAKETRYFIYALPPFIYFASWPLTFAARSRRVRPLLWTICVALLLSYGHAAWAKRYPRLSGYSAAADRIIKGSQGKEIVLFDGSGVDSGNLTFYLRLRDREHRIVLLTKGLYVTRILAQFGAIEVVHNQEELEHLLAGYGIRQVVISDKTQLLFPIQKSLRDLLLSSHFKLVATFPLAGDDNVHAPGQLLLYENQQPTKPTEAYLRLRMMTLNHDIIVPLRELGID